MLFSRSATVSTSLGYMCSWLGEGVLWWTWHKRNWQVQDFKKRNDPSKWQGGLNTWPMTIVQLFVLHHILKQKQWISAASIFSLFLGFWCSFEACTTPFCQTTILVFHRMEFQRPGASRAHRAVPIFAPLFARFFSVKTPNKILQRSESVCSWICLLHFATGYGNQNQANMV